MLKNLLWYRFVIFNMMALLGVAASYQYGLAQALILGDSTRISSVVAIVGVLGLMLCTKHAWVTAQRMNKIKRGDFDFRKRLNKDKVLAKLRYLEQIAEWLALLGLLGTVIGFALMVHAIGSSELSDASQTRAAIKSMFQGLKTAQYATIMGIVFGLWIEINYRMIHTATVCMLEDQK